MLFRVNAWFNSSVILVNSQLVCLPPVVILIMFRLFELSVSCICSATLAFVLNKLPRVNKCHFFYPIERSSIECPITKTNVITLANRNTRNKPIRTRSTVFQTTGFVHSFRTEIQGFFKDFSKREHENMCRAKTCAVHLWPNVHARESNKTRPEMKKKNEFRSIARRLHVVCMNVCNHYNHYYNHYPKT